MGKKLRKTIFGLCSLTALVHGYNQLVFKYSTRKELLDKNNGKYLKTKHGKVFYTVKGEGEPILLIHDISCASSGMEWSKIENKLALNNKVYIIDLLGCGRSDKPEITYTSYLYLQIIEQFINEVIGSKTNIAATGKAASIVTLMAEKYEELVDKIIIISPEYIKKYSIEKYEIKEQIMKYVINMPVLGTFVYNMSVSRNMLEEQFEDEYFSKKSRIQNNLISAYYESAHLGGPSARFLYSSLYYNYLYCNPLCSIGKIDSDKIMIILGKNYSNTEKIMSQYEECCSEIKISVLEDTAMLPQLELAEKVSGIISNFCN